MLHRRAFLPLFALTTCVIACSGDPHAAGTPAPGSGASASAGASPSAPADASTSATATPAPLKESGPGLPPAYAKMCTGTLKVEMTIMRAEGAGGYGGWAEKTPAGTTFLLGARSFDYAGYFVTSDGVWAKLGAQSEKLEPDVTFTSACAPKALPKTETLPQVTVGRATIFGTQELKGTGCILDGGVPMTGYGYMALGDNKATVWSNEIKAKCGCEKCYSRDIHVEYLIPLSR